jgi:hypothetical protein
LRVPFLVFSVRRKFCVLWIGMRSM